MLSAKERYLSKCMSMYLDELGFDHERIQERIKFNTKLSKALDLSTKCLFKSDKFDKIIAGSTGEGIGMLCSNDLDLLYINHAVICCDSCIITESDKLVFKMMRKKAPAGYTFLKLMSKGTDYQTYENIEHALVKRKTELYLSSKQYMTKNDENILQIMKDSFISQIAYVKKPQGPSIPTFVEGFDKEGLASSLNISDQGMDFVRAFPCQPDDKFLIAWKARDRQFSWPSKENIDKVMSLPVHVVAVGKKGTKNEGLQWRISFTLAEIYLVKALNNTQTKVLVMMKLIAKHVLQPLCRNITSYVVKNVVLWLAERIDRTAFFEENLILRLTDALEHLKTAVEKENLPSYMIPQRNLIQNKITRAEKELLVRKVTFLQVNAFKMVNEFFSGWCPCNYYRKIEKISHTFYNANLIDILITFAFSCNTAEDLAGLNTELFSSKSLRHVYLFMVVFILVSFYLHDKKDNNKEKNKRKAQTMKDKRQKKTQRSLRHNIRSLTYDKQGHQGKAAFNERSPNPTQ